MRVRLGYVAIALNLDKVTSSSTVTYSRYSKINSEEERLKKLKEDYLFKFGGSRSNIKL